MQWTGVRCCAVQCGELYCVIWRVVVFFCSVLQNWAVCSGAAQCSAVQCDVVCCGVEWSSVGCCGVLCRSAA